MVFMKIHIYLDMIIEYRFRLGGMVHDYRKWQQTGTSKEQKQEEIIKCFNEVGHALKINFLSAYRTDQFPPSYAVTTAKDINPWINEEINKYSDRGIVLYDFITTANMDYFFKGLL